MESNFRQVAELYGDFMRFATASYDRCEQDVLLSINALYACSFPLKVSVVKLTL